MLTQNKLLWINILILMVIGYFAADSLTCTTIADIQHGIWRKITNPDGTFFYSEWPKDLQDEQVKQHQAWLQNEGLTMEQVSGYGLRIKKIHKLTPMRSASRMHLFDTEAAAIRFAKENGLPDSRINPES
ncbi:MAG TPA: hypothetical protein VIR63_04690 [Pontiella sp.]